MRSFVYCALLVLICQLATSSPINERSEVEASKEQSSEKFFPLFPPPPPVPFIRPPLPPFGFKDNHQNAKRSEVETAKEESSEKFFPILPPPPPPPFFRPHLPPFGFKDSHQNEKRSEVAAHQESQSTEKFFPGYGFPILPPPHPFFYHRRPFGYGFFPPPPFGFKDKHQNEKRSEVESSKEKSTEKFFPGLLPILPPFPPFGFLKDAKSNDEVRALKIKRIN
ncbi:expressed protein [Phakopsora pachyrhizi]|uniref:Expressed protein n=1 Tax=Phakopsora pachyrhizi TaxID=170000 RepID=A0AAV0AS28_PHAPC|nr:expressed protein [Phakopsora pachyrhizi]